MLHIPILLRIISFHLYTPPLQVLLASVSTPSCTNRQKPAHQQSFFLFLLHKLGILDLEYLSFALSPAQIQRGLPNASTLSEQLLARNEFCSSSTGLALTYRPTHPPIAMLLTTTHQQPLLSSMLRRPSHIYRSIDLVLFLSSK